MKEIELAKDVFNQLNDDSNEIKQKYKFLAMQVTREIDNTINFEQLKKECKKLKIEVSYAKDDKFYKKLIKQNKIKESLLFQIRKENFLQSNDREQILKHT